ncbi:MAG: hypothetical protein ACLP1Y_05900 [Candidatus Acidiferrales bacterium]
MTLTKDHASRGGTFLLGEDRRRSQRVMIRVSVTLKFQIVAKTVTVSAHTVSVNDHGAMLLCPRVLEAGTHLAITNDTTRREVAGHVTRAPRDTVEGYFIPVEFLEPAADFWQITFPPSDWKQAE